MSEQISYTTEEIARLLKVSKLTVYDLIKKGELPAYRVGKQMRIDHDDLEMYKQRAKDGMLREQAGQLQLRELQNDTLAHPPDTGMAPDAADRLYPAQHPPQEPTAASPAFVHAAYARPEEILRNIGTVQPVTEEPLMPPSGMRPLVITGQDTSLDLLARYMEKDGRFRALRSFAGSMDSLVSMYMGHSDIVSTHLYDGETGEYNLPYVRKLLVSRSFTVINLVSRRAGLYIQRGNPKRINSWQQLGQTGIRLANRERGAGARVLLDEQLRLNGIRPSTLRGYDREETSHIAVAARIAAGEADVGVGSEKAAAMVGIEFIPLAVERYDLVVLNRPEHAEWIALLKRTLQSEEFKRELQAIGGYDLSRTGEIIYETDY